MIRGSVVDAAGLPVGGAFVTLQSDGSAPPSKIQTDAAGAFTLPAVPAGHYRISAEKASSRSAVVKIEEPSNGSRPVRLILNTNAAGQTMEFADQPNFTIAGVTDWTAVGGHGSDATLRTSEDLARRTAALKAQATAESSPALHERELAEAAERAGDPLAAVRAYEQAVRLEPSEANYFAWGSELLVHRAVWQAVEVFRTGNRSHPGSARMLTGLGAALFAGDLFAEAAASLCSASDLDPTETAPYTFMGRVAMAAPAPLHCIEPRLARFARQQPQNAQANYLYAMALWKHQEHAPTPQLENVRSLLNKAVADDSRCAEAWLQLGILAAVQHDTAEAIRAYSRAIEADPQLGEAHYRLGVAYDRSGAAEKARHEFALHDEIEKSQAVAVEQQRKEVKQFLIVLGGEPAPSAH